MKNVKSIFLIVALNAWTVIDFKGTTGGENKAEETI